MHHLIPITVIFQIVFGSPAFAETATYGSVDLTGLARNSWPLNPPGKSNAMVCNVNGPDGFLTIRTSSSSSSTPVRKLNRLAIVVINTGERNGNWIRVLSAHRNHTIRGRRQDFESIPVTGWAHDGYLCDFLD